MCLPLPGQRGCVGWTLPIVQWWWGHRAMKATWLYIVGVEPGDVPPIPLRLGEATHVVTPWAGLRKGMPGYRPRLRQPEREHTPIELARWLVELAGRCRVGVTA